MPMPATYSSPGTPSGRGRSHGSRTYTSVLSMATPTTGSSHSKVPTPRVLMVYSVGPYRL